MTNLIGVVKQNKGTSKYILQVYTIKRNVLDLVSICKLDRSNHYGLRTEIQHAAAESGAIPKRFGSLLYKDESSIKIQIIE